jgi:glycosyltransferase involved in cell wall biosynthesis
MACGTPVITSDCSSLIEIAKDCALCCNPYEVDDIAKAMETIGTDESLRKRLINEGLRNASAYTWEKTTRETIKVLTSCLA